MVPPWGHFINIRVVYENNEKPCGPLMNTRSLPAPGLPASKSLTSDHAHRVAMLLYSMYRYI